MKIQLWPTLVVVLLLSGVVVNLGMVALAVNDPSFAVEKNYYQKAIQWDQTVEQEKQNARLGWKLQFVPVPTADMEKKRRVCFGLFDRTGAALSGASISFVAFHGARASRHFRGELPQMKGNKGCVEMYLRRAGLWEFRFVVKRGRARFTETQRHMLHFPKS